TLKFHRENSGFSQQDVANQLNISRQSISKWENDRGYPDIDNLIRLSQMYQISIDELLKENEQLKKIITKNEEEIAHKKKKLSMIKKYYEKPLADEGVLLLIMATLSCLLFPIGFIMLVFIFRRNKKANTYYKLVTVMCICSLFLNLYNTYVYATYLFNIGTTVNIEKID
ncbi:helix-turn-helix transcriptional regulator, partial [Enterococcus sp. PFB1-1]|uniref:helix-turn-helix domain-containing protein n=2 Tax=unclassified Enterococcus TaxID=2608891 RepID=UPI002473231B